MQVNARTEVILDLGSDLLGSLSDGGQTRRSSSGLAGWAAGCSRSLEGPGPRRQPGA
jgi:hypothetical protein